MIRTSLPDFGPLPQLGATGWAVQRWVEPSTRAGPARLRQLGDDGVVGGVDRLAELVVGDRTAEPQRVPAGATDVGHHRGVVGVLEEPLVGLGTGRPTLEADRVGAQEGEDLVRHLGDEVALPGLVGPGTGFGQAVVTQGIAVERGHGSDGSPAAAEPGRTRTKRARGGPGARTSEVQ